MKISPFKVEEWMNRYEAGALYDLTTTCIKPLTINELLALSDYPHLIQVIGKGIEE